MLRSRLVRAAAGMAGVLCCSVGLAQNTLEHPVGDVVPLVYKSGFHPNPNPVAKVVDTQIIQMPTSNWMRLYFGSIALDTGSYIKITSMADGEVQVLDNAGVAMWSNSTAYFNGDTISIELIAGPMTEKNFFEVDRLGRQMAVPEGDPGQCGICGGVDDRTLSGELWSGRIMPVGCTGSVYCNGNGMVTAGHCVDGQSNLVMHFNVPASAANCATNAPPVNDQFPVLPGWQFQNGGIGADWAAYQVGTNGLGQTPFARYGQLRALAAAPAANGSASRIWGYGLDTNCVRSQVQQFSPGNISSVAATNYQFTNDIRGGNSGSGFLNANNEIIGIVTHCSFAGCPGYATRVDLPAFVTGRTTVGCAPAAAPVNNNCGNATTLGLGSVNGTTIAATNDGTSSCGTSNASPDVWYLFRPNCNGTYRFSTCSSGTTYDTVLSVHSGCPGTAANQLTNACNDDAGCSTGSLHSQVDVALSAGTFYYVRVSGFNGASGNFTLTTSAVATDPAPANDLCAAATAIGLGSIDAANYCAGTDGSTSCGFQTANDVWYSFTPGCTGSYTFSTCGGTTNFDTVLSLHSACPGTTANQIACNDDFCGLRSSVSANLTAGTTYIIRVAGYFGAVGNFTLTSAFTGQSNDSCVNAIDVSAGGAFNGNLCGATNDGTASCGASAGNPDVWYRWTNPSCFYRTLTVTGCGSNALSGVDTVISIHDGCGGSQLACSDDSFNICTPNVGTLDSVVSAPVGGGQTVFIRVSKFGTRILAPFVINVSAAATQANDACANAVSVPAGTYPFCNSGATTDGPNVCGAMGSDIWFRYTATATGLVTVNTCGSSFDTVVTVYPDGCPAGAALTCNDDDFNTHCSGSSIRDSWTQFSATNGTTYLIQVGGFASGQGSGLLTIGRVPTGCWGSCVADFDDGSGTGVPDGGVTIEDLLYYLSIFENGLLCADVDDGSSTNTLDGGVTIDDLLYFLLRFETGC